ncbi:MAG: META domain-containing protein [Candidatus Hydrogenedentes bacterium]|nr:META domain-containing protein [Candidatus Hydrogenedentota bacterium]
MWTSGTKSLACCLALLAIAGCAGNSKATSESQAGISGPEWRLESYGPLDSATSVPDAIEITILVNDSREVSGSSGCNTYRGSCTVNGQSIRFASISSTKRACPDPPEVMKLERQFLTALAEITRYEINDNVLTLFAREGRGLVFRRGNS